MPSTERIQFRNRAREVSRLEAFTDIVFGFALTLLVVSLEVPKSYAELMEDVHGFLGFAICFAILIWIWHSHYTFTRRYDLHDPFTIVINSVLLFMVLFYVYPLKFLFNVATGSIAGTQTPHEARMLFTVYGLGLAAIFTTYVILYRHAWSLRHRLELNEVEVHDTATSILDCTIPVVVALLSVGVAWLLPASAVGPSGFVYFLIGPLAGYVGASRGAKRRAVEEKVRAAAVTPVAKAAT